MDGEHFEAVVIGSGFGGSVMTYRLSEAGLRVCLLERGKAYPPGSFPRSPHRMKHNFWNPSEDLYGLYNLWSFSKVRAVVSSGLGGGSHLRERPDPQRRKVVRRGRLGLPRLHGLFAFKPQHLLPFYLPYSFFHGREEIFTLS
jgi:choline dehydrogenase-like flavoprotein